MSKLIQRFWAKELDTRRQVTIGPDCFAVRESEYAVVEQQLATTQQELWRVRAALLALLGCARWMESNVDIDAALSQARASLRPQKEAV